MYTVLLTYDLEAGNPARESKHNLVKNAMKKNGYADETQTTDGKIVPLPNTTLEKSDITIDIALKDLRVAAELNGAKVEKAIAVLLSKALVI